MALSMSALITMLRLVVAEDRAGCSVHAQRDRSMRLTPGICS